MSNLIRVGKFSYVKDENGNWLAKSIPRLKTKPVYKDAPRYPIIYEYEEEAKSNFDKLLDAQNKEIANFLLNGID